MSWKFAELKWRQDLGIYESWSGQDVDNLPLERKRAIKAFEQRQLVSNARRRSTSLQQFPTRQLSRGASVGTSPTLPTTLAPSVEHLGKETIRKICSQNHNNILHPCVSDCQQNIRGAQRVQRSHSCSNATVNSEILRLRLTKLNFLEPQKTLPQIPTSHEQQGQDCFRSCFTDAASSDSLKAFDSCDELTRLLDHAQSPGYRLSAASSGLTTSRILSTVEPLEYDRVSVEEPTSSAPGVRPADLLNINGAEFEVLHGGNPPKALHIASPPDTLIAFFPSTVSKHYSTSALIPKNKMADSRSPSPESTPHQRQGQHEQTSPPRLASAAIGTRRTTPVYQTLGQAYSSITGGLPSSGFQNVTPGTDSLNEVYARALAEDMTRRENLAGERHRAISNTLGTGTNIVDDPHRPSVRFPFERQGSPDSIERGWPANPDDNPAGLVHGSNDIPMSYYPILRSVNRGSAASMASPAPRGLGAEYDSVEDQPELSTHVTFTPGRHPEHTREDPPRVRTPYPQVETASSEENSEVESTVGEIVEEYRAQPVMPVQTRRSTSSSLTTPRAQNTVAVSATPERLRSHESARDTVGAAPDWPLPPAPPSTPVAQANGVHNAAPIRQNGYHLSSSPPTYGSTQGLLNRSGLNGLAVRGTHMPLANVTNGQRRLTGSLDVDNLEAGRRYSHTVSPNDLGVQMPLAAPTSVPAQTNQASEVDDDAAQIGGPVREPMGMSYQSASSGNSHDGVDISLLQLRDELRNRMSGYSSAFDESDAAWETTQGTNTQRNSAVPESDFPTFSSSINASRATAWDPLAENSQTIENLGGEVLQFHAIEQVPDNEAALPHVGQMHGNEELTTPQQLARPPTNNDRNPPPTLQRTVSFNQSLNQAAVSPPTQPINGAVQPLRRHPRTRFPRNRITPEEDTIEMISATASNTASPSQNNQTDTVVEWREEARDETRDATLAAIARYQHRNRAMRPYINARLTIDRCVMVSERDPAFVRRQRGLTSGLLIAGVLFWPFGGFLLLRSLAANDRMGVQALLELSVCAGGRPVKDVNERDCALAGALVWWAGVLWFGLFAAVCAAALAVAL